MRARWLVHAGAALALVASVSKSDADSPIGAAVSERGDVAVATNGDVYSMILTGGQWEFEVNAFGDSVPGSPVVTIQRNLFDFGRSVQAHVLLEDGVFYVVQGEVNVPGPNWRRVGVHDLFVRIPHRRSPIVSVNWSSDLTRLSMMLASGDVFVTTGFHDLVEENRQGNIFDGTVQAEQTSWSKLKTGYRDD